MATVRVRGLATVIKAVVKACDVMDTFAPAIRLFVPSGSQASFDDAHTKLHAACDALRAIDYLDTSTGTNAPWGV